MIPPVDEEDFEMIQVPETTSSPFRVTRASHLVYTVRDLSLSRNFYTEVLGLVVTDEDQEALYYPGKEVPHAAAY
jgi:catechol 2,3-dioxygenase